MYQRFFEQVIPGEDWYRIRHKAEEIAQERAMNAIRLFPSPYIGGFPTHTPIQEKEKPRALFKKIQTLQYNKLIGQIIASEFKDSALDINGYNPMDSIAGVSPHLEKLDLTSIADPFHSVQNNPVDYGKDIVNATFDAYCPVDYRYIDIHARVVDLDGVDGDTDCDGLIENPLFWVPYKKMIRSPSEYWLILVDARDWETSEDLVIATHYFIGRNDFADAVCRHKKALKKSDSDMRESDYIVCKPKYYCEPAKIFEPHEVEKWIKLKGKYKEKAQRKG